MSEYHGYDDLDEEEEEKEVGWPPLASCAPRCPSRPASPSHGASCRREGCQVNQLSIFAHTYAVGV